MYTPAAGLNKCFTRTLVPFFSSADVQPCSALLCSLGLHSSGLTVFAADVCIAIQHMQPDAAVHGAFLFSLFIRPRSTSNTRWTCKPSPPHPTSAIILVSVSRQSIGFQMVSWLKHISGRCFVFVHVCGRGLQVKLHSVCGRCRCSSCVFRCPVPESEYGWMLMVWQWLSDSWLSCFICCARMPGK